MPHVPGFGAIFGIVSEEGVAKNASRVALYDRSNFQLVSTGFTNADGGYVFNGLNTETNDYMVLAVDDDGTIRKNAQVQDYIQPISAISGSAWPGNWYLTAMRKSPSLMYLMERDGAGGQPISRQPFSWQFTTSNFGGGIGAGVSSLTPGAPQLPSIQLINGSLGIPGRLIPNGGPDTSPWRTTFEWVSTFDGSFNIRQAIMDSSGLSHSVSMQIRWNATTKVFTFVSPDSGGSMTSRGTISAPSLGAAPAHIIVAWEWGNVITLYINGVASGTLSLSATNATSSVWIIRLILGPALVDGGTAGAHFSSGFTNVSNTANVTMGPYAAYVGRIFTAAEALDHYNKMMVGTSQMLTGYAAEAVLDAPAYYFRLNEPSVGTVANLIDETAGGQHVGTVTPAQAGFVTGGLSTAFAATGGIFCANGANGRAISPRQMTIAFWARLETAGGALMRIITADNEFLGGSTSSFAAYGVSKVATTDRLQFYVAITGGSLETINFNYALPAGQAVLIHIVLNKVAGQAILYVNGTQQEVQAISGTLFNMPTVDGAAAHDIQGPSNLAQVNTSNYRHNLSIGAWVRDNTLAAGNTFIGRLAEVAAYGVALSPTRIAAHWAARTAI